MQARRNGLIGNIGFCGGEQEPVEAQSSVSQVPSQSGVRVLGSGRGGAGPSPAGEK